MTAIGRTLQTLNQTAGSQVRGVRSRSLLVTALVGNSLVVLTVIVVAEAVTRRHAGTARTLIVLGAGVCLSIIVNIIMLRRASHHFDELSQAMESVHKGELGRRVPVDALDPGLRRLALSYNGMCARLEDESHRYAAKLTSSVEEERRRIGRGLHDQTSQTLAATLVNLDLAEKALAVRDLNGSRDRVASSKALVAHSMEEIKLLVHDLRPVMLDDIGLAPTLRWYIKSHLHDAEPEIVTDFAAADLRLPSEVETALYRIAQEMLANAVRHASATKIVVRLETRPGYADLAVIDNGHGFDPEAALHNPDRRGVGLLSIKERVELVGGTVNIVSAVGRGTRMYAVIPFDTDNRPTETP